MNAVLVTTSDDIVFRVETDPRAAPLERAFARRLTAAQLQAHAAFVRVRSLDDLVAPEPLPEALALTPAQRRAAFYVIRGGKSWAA